MGSMHALALVLALGTLGALPGLAQQISDEELLERFQTQRDAFRSASESGMGRTRGLTLVTVDDASAPSTETTADLPVGGGATVTSVPATERNDGLKPLISAQAPKPTPVVFGKLDPDLQVNVRIEFAFELGCPLG